ncbi:MAG: hypothetical protein COA79_25540 [Planctomycetota bacterium]|nr:MAG: hypothetical protein COA79_25540 [Planctomycetota bacterium]
MISTNLNGIQNQLANLNKSANRIATKFNDPDFDLTTEIGKQIVSENGVKLNIKLIKVQNENLGTLLDLIA